MDVSLSLSWKASLNWKVSLNSSLNCVNSKPIEWVCV